MEIAKRSTHELRKDLISEIRMFIAALEEGLSVDDLLKIRNKIRGILLTLEDVENKPTKLNVESRPHQFHKKKDQPEPKNPQP